MTSRANQGPLVYLPRRPKFSIVYDTYWKFAFRRQEVYFQRLQNKFPPWTSDEVISNFRFTNAYRASDRVSQHLIRDVIYDGNDWNVEDMFLRIMLFKIFNRWSTWKKVESLCKNISLKSFSLDRIDALFRAAISAGERLYSAAYIMPAIRNTRGTRKHIGHLLLIQRMLEDRLPSKIQEAPNLQSVYNLLLAYKGLGPFLAFQYTIDINYSTIINFDENDFVVPGPGAIRGIRKCVSDMDKMSEEGLIKLVCDRQKEEFSRRDLPFRDLFGRDLKLIDCQNLFCEVDKYSRVAHPTFDGDGVRKRIKQKYVPAAFNSLPRAYFPPKWGLEQAISDFYGDTNESGRVSAPGSED